MTRRHLVVLLVLAAACGDRTAIPKEDGLNITAGTGEVALGQAFPLTVVRVWSKAQAPQPWNDDALAPLAVRHVETTRREDDSHVEETRRYDAYAFTLEDVTVGDKELRVKRALDPDAPGPAELPPPPETTLPWAWPAAGAAALFVLLLLYRSRSRPAPPAPPPPPPKDAPGPDVVALERLARLRAAGLDTQPFYLEATGLVREYIGARFDVPAETMTTEETLREVPAGQLAPALDHCDRVKFGRRQPSAAERDDTLDAIERFVKETA